MSELHAIEELRGKGFVLSFTAEAGGLRCAETGELFAPEDLVIVDTRRFEGASNVSDEAIVYAIESRSGKRGIVTDAYGPYASPELAALLDRIDVVRER